MVFDHIFNLYPFYTHHILQRTNKILHRSIIRGQHLRAFNRQDLITGISIFYIKRKQRQHRNRKMSMCKILFVDQGRPKLCRDFFDAVFIRIIEYQRIITLSFCTIQIAVAKTDIVFSKWYGCFPHYKNRIRFLL